MRLNFVLCSALVLALAGPAIAKSTKTNDVPDLIARAATSGKVDVISDQTSSAMNTVGFQFTEAQTDYWFMYAPKDGLKIVMTPVLNNDQPAIELQVADVNGDGVVDFGNDGMMRVFSGKDAMNDGVVMGTKYQPFFQAKYRSALNVLKQHIAGGAAPKKLAKR